MKNFIKYFWNNSKGLIGFIIVFSIIGFFIGPDTYPFIIFLLCIAVVALILDFIALRKIQKTQSDIEKITHPEL